MASSTEVRSGLKFGWAIGDNFKSEMDANLQKIGRVLTQLSILDRTLTAPPGSPVDGDSYIVATGGTGAWAGSDGKVAIWDATLAGWVIYTPRVGWLAYIENEQVLSAYKAAGWSAGIAI